MNENTAVKANPLATEKISKLIPKFAIPSIISGLVSASYNIVDQIFIGRSAGLLGNAATNVAFPIVTISLAIALLLGVGSASNFSLELGRGHRENAGHTAGTGITFMVVSGVALAAFIFALLRPLMTAFGATEIVMPYALTYTSITARGIPFYILGTGGSHLVRADGSPKFAMISMTSGAVLNIILDPILIFGLNMGIAGAALATTIGQIVSALLVLYYFSRFRTLKLTREYLIPRFKNTVAIASLGMAACFNQLAMTIVQITMNNTLTEYGAKSEYGSEIPLACVGVITKVSILLFAITLGIAQGCQPINGYNYGAKNYGRVKETYRKAAISATVVAVIAFLCFQLFPRQIVSIFGEGSEAYYRFAEKYFRIFLMMTFLNGLQIITSTFLTSIGKATLGIFLSLTRQILFLLPLILLFPLFFGIDGVMYAGPIADGFAAALAIFFVAREMRIMTRLEKCANPA
ncbi:MAG: MATE family efflux transporter [Bacillota bacterium]